MIHHNGRVEVIWGGMFCGKTEELIRRARRALIAKQKVQVFKPVTDTRWSKDHVTSHDGENLEALPVNESSKLLAHLCSETTVVAIDEVQFFDEGIIGVVETLVSRGIRVILAGLDTDFRAEPFGFMPKLAAMAEESVKLHAICVECGEEASRTQRIVNGKPANWADPIILVGATESYEARCRAHHVVPGRPKP